MSCYRCGGDHNSQFCPELKRDKNIAKQTEILEAQERRLKSEDKTRKKAERAEMIAAQKADPNYKSPTKKLFKFGLWFFVFMFAFAGLGKISENNLWEEVIVIVLITCIAGIIYWFKKKK